MSMADCVVYNPIMYPEFEAFDVLFPDLARYLQNSYRVAGPIAGVNTRWQALVRRNEATP